jgi:hypothetical protein
MTKKKIPLDNNLWFFATKANNHSVAFCQGLPLKTLLYIIPNTFFPGPGRRWFEYGDCTPRRERDQRLRKMAYLCKLGKEIIKMFTRRSFGTNKKTTRQQ